MILIYIIGVSSVATVLLYPLSLLHADNKLKKKLDRQRLLTVGYFNLYRYATRYVHSIVLFWEHSAIIGGCKEVHRQVLLQQAVQRVAAGVVAVRGSQQARGEQQHAQEAQQHDRTVL